MTGRSAALPLALALLAAAACARTPAPPPAAAAPFLPVELGLCEDYPEETRSPDRVRADMDLVRAAGVRLLRVSLGWDGTESQRDRYDWTFWDAFFTIAAEKGVQIIPYVCYTPRWNAVDPADEYWTSPPRDLAEFEEFTRDLAARYRGRVASWEIWNEPDNRAYWRGTPGQFAELLAAGARGVRAGDPAAQVVFGGLAGELDFLEQLLAQHHAARFVDVFNLHAYYETWNPDPLERLPEYLLRARELVQRWGEHEPLWLAEVGYSSFRRGAHVSDQYRARHAYEHTPAHQAAALVRTVALALSTGAVTRIAWYELRDLPPGEAVIGDVNNRHLGVTTTEGRPKPALEALRFVAGLLALPARCIDDEVLVTRRVGSDAEVHVFERADGVVVAVCWLHTRVFGQAPTSGDAPDEREERIALRLPARAGRELVARDALGRPVDAGSLSPTVSGPELRDLVLRGEGALVLEVR